MKRSLVVFAVLALFSFLAFAAPSIVIDANARWVKAGIWLGQTAAIGDRLTASYATTVTVDFDGGVLGCTDAVVGLAGPVAGDPCFVGAPSSGGAASNIFSCFVSDAGQVTVRNCHGGVSADPASASYSVRVISAQ